LARCISSNQIQEIRVDNKEQTELWNGPAGDAWVAAQQLLDRMFEPFERLLADAAAEANARHVLDVGCGTGATTMAIAKATRGEALGVDVSRPMIALAQSRAQRAGSTAGFLVGDAQTQVFRDAHYDRVVSRFGIMFFADPVAAFANLRRATRPKGALQVIAFRSAADNPFMTAAERAAAPLLQALPVRNSEGPGQFAFADAGRVRGILEQAGWAAIHLRALDLTCAFPLAALDSYIERLGPVGLALRSADEPTRQRVTAAVRAGFEPYVQGDEVRFTAACWSIEASN
jgi:SAM-dependent methyltransferase